jgi:methyl-accepting chemotaxis protein
MSDSDAVDTLLRDTESLFNDSPRRTAPTRSAMGDRGGGVIDTGTNHSSKLFSVVKVTCSNPRLCFGMIGAGSAFCLEEECGVKSHEGTKMKFLEKADSQVFIRRNVATCTAFTEPSLAWERIPEEVWSDWKTKQLPLKNWQQKFLVVENSKDVLETAEDIKQETYFADKADKFKTPAKPKRDPDDIGPFGGNWQFSPYQRILPIDPSELMSMIGPEGMMNKGELTKIVHAIEKGLADIGAAVEEANAVSRQRFIGNENDTRFISVIVQNLKSGIGSSLDLDSRFAAPTVWGSVSFTSEEIIRIESELLSVKADTIPGIKKTVAEVMNEIKSKGKTSDKIVKIVSSLLEKMKQLRAEFDEIKGEVDLLHVASSGAGRRTEEASDADDLLKLLNPSSFSKSTDTPRPSPPMVNPDTTTAFAHTIRQLVEDVGLLKASAEDTSIKFAHLGLRNLNECGAWITYHFKDFRYGLIMDPLVMLDRIFGEDEASSSTHLKTMETRINLKIATGAEAATLRSLQFARPRIFHSGRVAMNNDRNKSRLNKLPDHSTWKAGGDGVKHFIMKKMNLLHSAISSDISYAFGSGESQTALMVATLSLTNTVTFLTMLCTLIDTMFEKLHVFSKFTMEQGWCLTMQIFERILGDLYAPKDGVVDAMTLDDQWSVCTHTLWATFKCHDVMATYVEHQFENHPAISTEYVKFLATNSGFEKVEKLSVQVTSLSDKLARSSDDVKKALAKADTASTKNAELSREMTEMKARLRKLEAKIS